MGKTKEMNHRLLGVVMTVMVMCVMFICISATALAAQGKVTTDVAKIREEASTSSTQVGSVQNGAVLEILSEVTGTDGRVWYQVRFGENKTGYIRSDLMTKLADTTTPPSSVATEVTDVQPVNCTVTGGQVNVRSNASTGGEKVGQVRRGEVMTIDGMATDSAGDVWYRVNFSSNGGNVTGFVRYDFVSVSGEIKPVEQVETPPVVDPPTEQQPPMEQDPIEIPQLSKDYDTSQDQGVWYLIDNVENKRYNLENVMDAAIKNPQIYDEMDGKVKSQKRWIIFLVILVILMSVGITLLVLKLKDVMDEAYFTAVEKDTIRQRQGQRQGESNGTQRKVMHTVGANSQKGDAPVKTSVPKMSINKPGDGKPQTVKVSNPADTAAPKPIQQRPVNKPVVKKDESKNEVTEETKVIPPVGKKVPEKAPDNTKQTWQSKNFMTDDDDDDDMEYGFLDWDDGDE